LEIQKFADFVLKKFAEFVDRTQINPLCSLSVEWSDRISVQPRLLGYVHDFHSVLALAVAR
jgi:hypothetical protein